MLAKIRESFAYGCADDVAVAQEIKAQYEMNGYLCDTHTAVAFKVAKEYTKASGSTAPMVILSTASPYKFPCSVLEALGSESPSDDFAAMASLEAQTKAVPPASLTALRGAAERFDAVIAPEEILEVARSYAK